MKKRGNRFGTKRKRHGRLGSIITLLMCIGVFALFLAGISSLTHGHEDEALERIRVAITRSAIQFYALEGRYPPHLDYLVDRFGLQIDFDRFIVHYNAFGSNIMPVIAVLPRDF